MQPIFVMMILLFYYYYMCIYVTAHDATILYLVNCIVFSQLYCI